MRAVCSIAAVALLGLVPAFYNGGPLLFNDSFVYLMSQLQGQVLPTRPTFYGPFFYILAGRHLVGWLVLQSVLQSVVLHLWWLTSCGPPGWASLTILSALTLITPLAFEASLLLPDFSGALLLVTSGLILVWGDKLSGARRGFCVVLTAFFVTMHLAHVAWLALLLTLWVPLGRSVSVSWRELSRSVGTLALCLGVAVMMISVQNRVRINTWSPTPARDLFLFARFYSAGPLRDYLQDQCGRPDTSVSPRLCDAVSAIGPDWTAQDILWRADSPMSSSHLNDLAPLLKGLLGDAAASDPVGFLGAFMRCGAEQFIRITVMDALYGPRCAMFEYPGLVRAALTADQLQALKGGPQYQRERAPVILCDWLYGFVYWGGMAGLLMIMVRIRNPLNAWFRMGLFLFLGLVINALVCGGLSALDGRYQLRVAWLPSTCCAIWLWAERRQALSSGVEGGPELRSS